MSALDLPPGIGLRGHAARHVSRAARRAPARARSRSALVIVLGAHHLGLRVAPSVSPPREHAGRAADRVRRVRAARLRRAPRARRDHPRRRALGLDVARLHAGRRAHRRPRTSTATASRSRRARGSWWFLAARDWDRFDALVRQLRRAELPLERSRRHAPLRARSRATADSSTGSHGRLDRLGVRRHALGSVTSRATAMIRSRCTWQNRAITRCSSRRVGRSTACATCRPLMTSRSGSQLAWSREPLGVGLGGDDLAARTALIDALRRQSAPRAARARRPTDPDPPRNRRTRSRPARDGSHEHHVLAERGDDDVPRPSATRSAAAMPRAPSSQTREVALERIDAVVAAVRAHASDRLARRCCGRSGG